MSDLKDGEPKAPEILPISSADHNSNSTEFGLDKGNLSPSSSSPSPSTAVAAANAATTTTTSTTTTLGELENDKDSQRVFSCDICEKVFTRKHNLETHRLVHSQNKPYTCAVCKSGFKRSHDLKRHRRMHTGEKPHVCHECDRSFARADALLRHTKHGCSSGSRLVLHNPSRTEADIHESQYHQSPEKRSSYETVHWKLTISNPTDAQSKYNKLSNSISGPYPEPAQTQVFDISSNQSNTRTTSVSSDANVHSAQQQQQQQLFNYDSSVSKISFLEHKILQLEKHIDNDQFRIRNLESRLMRLESSNLKN